MKLGKLKYALIALVLFSGVAEAQMSMKHPTDVRYIGGNMTNKRPFFKSLDAALNDVKALATSERPYTFWLVSDTVNVVDWDSVYQTGGLPMNDSIDVHYVAVGKIKWAGFGQGGGGSGGGSVIVPPANRTTHYNLWTYTGQTGLPTWQDRMAENQDSIDLKLWELIVYTDSIYLYIENDTLKIRASTIQALIDASGARPDTTIISYKAVNETITGTRLFNDNVTIGTGSLVLASANNNSGTARVIWSSSNKPYWSGSGAVGDTSQIILVDINTGLLNLDSLITWNNLNAAVKDSITGMPFLTMAFADSAATPNAAQNVSEIITNTWNNLFTTIIDMGDMVRTGDSVQVKTAGYYYISYSLSYSGNNTDEYHSTIWINNIETPQGLRSHKEMTGTDPGVIGASGAVYINADEWIAMRLTNSINAGDPTFITGNLTIIRLR